MESEKPLTNETAARITLPRRRFLLQTGAAIGALTTFGAPLTALGAELISAQRSDSIHKANSRFFRFAIIADTHIIDDFYKGPEGNALDTATIFKTTARLESARALINSLSPAVERVFLVGDYFHDYPSVDYDFYFKNRTRIDNAKTLTDGFRAPVHVGFGNHDYAVPKVSREMSHELFQAKLGLKPYYAITHRGYKFIHLNNFTGNTWNPSHAEYNRNTGSLGEAQLNWFEAQLRERKPTFVFIHYPLIDVRDTEVRDYGILPLLKRYKENIQFVVSGHKHKWYDFARTFGPQHYVMGSTRYDEDAYMIVDVDTKEATYRIINLNLVDWATHYSQPYRQKIS
ncbi:MAG: metallophosphoesterase [Pyrinomonadaceae bacterium]